MPWLDLPPVDSDRAFDHSCLDEGLILSLKRMAKCETSDLDHDSSTFDFTKMDFAEQQSIHGANICRPPSTSSVGSEEVSPDSEQCVSPWPLSGDERYGPSSARALRQAPYTRSEGSYGSKWKCPICPETFSRAMLLDAHAKESRHRAYQCPDCRKSYIRQSALARHRRSHGPAECHPCPHCPNSDHPKSFQRRDHLQQHMREVHNRFDYARGDEARC